MEAETNYWLVWAIYLAATGIFYPIYWYLTKFRLRWLSYSLRALMAALILTPWYTHDQSTALAPALMVATLDAITTGTEAAVRAGAPLILALIAAEFVATYFWLLHKKSIKNSRIEPRINVKQPLN